MPAFETSRNIKHTAENMFSLVADIEKYPEFLPYCKSLLIRSRLEEEGKEFLLADMTVAHGIFFQTFTSRVTLDSEKNLIRAESNDKIFKNLLNEWRFESTSSGCTVHFIVDYEFKNKMIEMLMGEVFNYMFSVFIDAFEKRSDNFFIERGQKNSFVVV